MHTPVQQLLTRLQSVAHTVPGIHNAEVRYNRRPQDDTCNLDYGPHLLLTFQPPIPQHVRYVLGLGQDGLIGFCVDDSRTAEDGQDNYYEDEDRYDQQDDTNIGSPVSAIPCDHPHFYDWVNQILYGIVENLANANSAHPRGRAESPWLERNQYEPDLDVERSRHKATAEVILSCLRPRMLDGYQLELDLSDPDLPALNLSHPDMPDRRLRFLVQHYQLTICDGEASRDIPIGSMGNPGLGDPFQLVEAALRDAGIELNTTDDRLEAPEI